MLFDADVLKSSESCEWFPRNGKNMEESIIRNVVVGLGGVRWGQEM